MSGLTDKENFMSYPTKLTIIPDTRYSNQEITDKYAEHQSAYMLHKGYMHGELSDIIGYDICMTLEPNEGLEETIDEDGFMSPKDTQFSMNYDQVTPYHGVVIKHLLDEIEKLKEEIKKLNEKL